MFVTKPADPCLLQVITTKDGSNTLFHPGTGEHYHSMNGAVQESQACISGIRLTLFSGTNGL